MSKIEIGGVLAQLISYDDALILAFVAGDGWRLPTHDEWNDHDRLSGFWFKDRPLHHTSVKGWTGKLGLRLVRDLKDD